MKDTNICTIDTVNEFDNDTYAIVQFELKLRGRSLFYLVFPALILSILNLVGFILPAKSSFGNISLSINYFLSSIYF